MLKKHSWLTTACAILLLTVSAWAQETEPAANSNLTQASLPGGALRIREQSIPADIKQLFSGLVAAGGGKVRQGDAEVLAWAGGGYKKSDAPRLMRQVESTLQTSGWTYETGEANNGLVVFSLLKTAPTRRGIVGFFVPTDDALLLAWTELLPANSSPAASQNADSGVAGDAPRPMNSDAGATALNADNNVRASASIPRELIGKWDNGSVSALQYRDTVTGSTTPGRGSYFSYDIKADGGFQFIGMIQSTVYNCTTTLFNEKVGRAVTDGSTVTLIQTKNFWRKTNGCAPGSNSERDYTLEKETYRWRTKQDEYGHQLICLANDKGETCYRRHKE